MIDVKQAVQIAMNYVSDLYQQEGISDLALEEVELSDDEQNWYITIGFTRQFQELTGLRLTPLTKQAKRVYKIVTVRAKDGIATSMKIRELAAA